MEDIKPKEGDIVVCIKGGNKGLGWLLNKCFKVGKNMNHSDYISWPKDGSSGVYNNSLRFATYEEIQGYQDVGGDYITTDVLSNNLFNILEDLDRRIEKMERHGNI